MLVAERQFDRVAVMEVRTLSDAELAGLDVDGAWAHLSELQRFTNRLDAYRAKVVAVADKKGAAAGAGRRRMADALVARTGLGSGDARRAVRAAGTALEHPAVAGLFAQGQITQTQAVAVGGARVPEGVRSELLAGAATETSEQTIERVAAAERAEVDPDQRFLRQREMRCASRCYVRDGMWNLHVRLDPEAGARADAVLTAHSEQLWRDDKQAGRTQSRTPIQRLADTFTTILDTATSDSRGANQPAVTLNVTIPHTWLTEQTDTTGITNDGATLSTQTLRRLACDAHLLPTVLGGAGEVLDVGRARRTATDAQHRGLEARDRCCFNCGAPPGMCNHAGSGSSLPGCFTGRGW
jgi:5-methylcytosine-specific restriction protein A